MDIQHLEFWHWLIFGVLLMALEVLAPAMVLMWFGFGAIVTGITLWLFPGLGFAGQILMFALVSLVSVFGWRKSHFREENIRSDTPDLNNRLLSHIGKEYVLTDAIINGRGTIRVGDTAWRVQSDDDMPAGARVRVTGVDGVIFTVTKAD
jgi:membrane protein implicated in regulation of membrane protease activity